MTREQFRRATAALQAAETQLNRLTNEFTRALNAGVYSSWPMLEQANLLLNLVETGNQIAALQKDLKTIDAAMFAHPSAQLIASGATAYDVFDVLDSFVVQAVGPEPAAQHMYWTEYAALSAVVEQFASDFAVTFSQIASKLQYVEAMVPGEPLHDAYLGILSPIDTMNGSGGASLPNPFLPMTDRDRWNMFMKLYWPIIHQIFPSLPPPPAPANTAGGPQGVSSQSGATGGSAGNAPDPDTTNGTAQKGASNADPQQTQPPQTNSPPNANPNPTSDTTNAPSAPSNPNVSPLGFADPRPAQQRFIGANISVPLGGAGHGGGGGSSFVGGFGFGDGGSYRGGNRNRVQFPSGPEPPGGGGSESAPQQQTVPNPQDQGDDVWQTGGPEKTSSESSDITDDNRTRYENAPTSNSSSASADTGVSSGSREDPPGPPDHTWTSGRNLGGFGWDPNANRGDPNPEDDGGGSESKPTIPYGPHDDHVGGAPSSLGTRLPSLAARLLAQRVRRLTGYQSGDDLGAGGYNPRFNPDPDDGGGAPGPGDRVGGLWSAGSIRGGTLGGADATNIEPGPNGPDPDNEWGAGGYNPHYQPAGYAWTPYSRGGAGGTSRAAPALPARVSRVAAIRFK